MGGLVVYPHRPAPSYVWEMLHVDTGELFLHFDVRIPERILRPNPFLVFVYYAVDRLPCVPSAAKVPVDWTNYWRSVPYGLMRGLRRMNSKSPHVYYSVN